MLELSNATSRTQLDAVRGLMRAFIAWHRERHTQDRHLIDAYFDAAAFERELATLPGEYSPPSGRLLLATVDDGPAGCVALHQLGDGCCEMKRMFVYPRFRGQGVGLGLAHRIIEPEGNNLTRPACGIWIARVHDQSPFAGHEDDAAGTRLTLSPQPQALC